MGCRDQDHLERAGIDDARLWHLGHPKTGSQFSSSDEHYVIAIDDEAIDPTARQFDSKAESIDRRPLSEVSGPRHSAQPVEIGKMDPFFGGKELHGIPANWRDLADHPPPGDAIGWLIQGHGPPSRTTEAE